ncbi:MAG: ribonuclease R [Desulfonauticus sp.]|nr:ribonuclease R [Desulfonauticus sp.]
MKKITVKDILKVFKKADKPLTKKEIYALFGKKKSIQKRVKQLLLELEQSGKIMATGKAFCLVHKLPVLKGTLEVQRSGVGFVIPEDKRRKDIFVHPDNFQDAWHGDTVLVALLPNKKGKNVEGRIVKVLQRGIVCLVGKVKKQIGKTAFLVKPSDLRLKFSLIVESQDVLPINTLVSVKPGSSLEPFLWSGELLEVLGDESCLSVQEKLVKINHNIPTDFPEEVLKEVKQLPRSIEAAELKSRKDLRLLNFVTIDGAKAKDFDDAVYVEKKQKGYKLFVAIADVSHYVQFSSYLDKEALERGNSYYFPLSVEPMFPEELSNGLCSLNPNEPKLVMVVETDFNQQGKRLKSKFYPAVITSKFRLTYTQVHKAIELQDEEERLKIKPVLAMLEHSYELAKKIKSLRIKRGSIDFDLPEPEINLDLQEDVLDIKPRKRYFSHQLIEEFMVTTNEAVAEFLESKGMPFLYRVHPEPKEEKLESLFQLLKTTNLAPSVPHDTTPKDLQKLLLKAEQTDLDFLVNRLLLRSMMQAKYSPVNEGHFGLASSSYCHFTSPIRRYADLVVHRALKNVLQNQFPRKKKITKLKKLGEKLSRLERKAMEAEREILKRASVLALKDKVGTRFSGVISSLTDFGFWIELEEILAEGLVRLSSLIDDYYVFVPERQEIRGQRTGKVFKLGQKIKVRLEKTSLETLQLEFSLSK